MAKYKYTSNKNPQDGTEKVGVPGGELVGKGEELELTDEQAAQLRQHHNLHKVDGSDEAAEAAPAEAPESSKPARG